MAGTDLGTYQQQPQPPTTGSVTVTDPTLGDALGLPSASSITSFLTTVAIIGGIGVTLYFAWPFLTQARSTAVAKRSVPAPSRAQVSPTRLRRKARARARRRRLHF